MGEVYHCPTYLERHPLFKKYGSSLYELSECDYPEAGYFKDTNIPVIDLDGYERGLHRMQDCTSDAVVGIADLHETSLRNKRLLLTEFRMGYKNVENLDFSNIRKKYTHSCEILRKYDHEIKIDGRFALIFTRVVAPLAKNRINRLSKGSSKREVDNLDVYWPESFCNYINYGKRIPVEATSETKRKVIRWCSDTSIAFETFDAISEELESYWWKLLSEKRYTDLAFIKMSFMVFLSRLSFPHCEDGEVWTLVKQDITRILESVDLE